jgi:hypothetical protein
MKKIFRNFRFLCLIVITMMAFRVTTSSSPQGPAPIDPACVTYCVGLLYQCLSEGGKNNDHACISVYRHCIAHCKH